MSEQPYAAPLPGGRLHLQHGPIDLVVGADGDAAACKAAYAALTARFATVLGELCEELAALRMEARGRPVQGAVARRMAAAVAPHAAAGFITPMAAVAGAVADEALAAMVGAASLRRAYVNNGGDIALHLAPGEVFRTGLVARPDQPAVFATAVLSAADGVGGIATSGWRGRSFSLGIADAVTVCARDAAAADAAATVIANAVDLPGHPAVLRVPADSVQADSDLGTRLVVRGVGDLQAAAVAAALAAGAAVADGLVKAGLIVGAALRCQGATRVCFGDGRSGTPLPLQEMWPPPHPGPLPRGEGEVESWKVGAD